MCNQLINCSQSVTEESQLCSDCKKEHKLAVWFEQMKKLKKSGKIFPSVDKMLTEEFGKNWYKK